MERAMFEVSGTRLTQRTPASANLSMFFSP